MRNGDGDKERRDVGGEEVRKRAVLMKNRTRSSQERGRIGERKLYWTVSAGPRSQTGIAFFGRVLLRLPAILRNAVCIGELHQLQKRYGCYSLVCSFLRAGRSREASPGSWLTIVKAAGKVEGFVCKQTAVEVRRRSLVKIRW